MKGQPNLYLLTHLTPHSPTIDRPLGKSITHMPMPLGVFHLFPLFTLMELLCCPSC